ncbi:aldo/keto reductase [Nodularia sp. NIES-3585]|uniref:aldo/keto reductase n=1 Tax=Nodularia sp. NIES-3585 TaxID=1973477 RepID=UPI000B5CA119|nr:aldo/keto reductase [Nodularia sp. NIES-3585]GAX38384.1 aldo/keto reductase [Nodularia sp. NIES-3585]
MAIPGKATPEGTRRYKERQKNCSPTFFRETGEFIASSIGIGSLIGDADEQTNALVAQAVIESVRRGVNLIDSAISYRCEQGESSVGKGIQRLLELGEASRDELIICTKGGILPYSGTNATDWFYQNYVEKSNSSIKITDLIGTRYCIHPEYLLDQINRSLTNLGLETIDVYYIHNPERNLTEIAPDIFYEQIRAAFEVMENAVNNGKIAAYGLATWEGFRVSPTSRDHLDLVRLKSIAREVAKNREDRFRFIQLPLNMAMPEALLTPTQKIEGKEVPVLEAAYHLGIHPIASNSIFQAQVVGQIPQTIALSFGHELSTDCQRALQYTRSAPMLLTALVGMKTIQHIEENLALSTVIPLQRELFQELTYSIIQVLNSMQVDTQSWSFDLPKLFRWE